MKFNIKMRLIFRYFNWYTIENKNTCKYFSFKSYFYSKFYMRKRKKKYICICYLQNPNSYAFSNYEIRANSPSIKRGEQTHWIAYIYIYIHACTHSAAPCSWRVKSNRPHTINTLLITYVSKWTRKAQHY